MSTYGLKDASNITFVKRGTTTPVLYIDYANQTNTQWQSNRVYAKKKGTQAIAWDSARTGKLTIQTEMFDLRLLAMMAGDDDLHKGTNTIFKRKVFQLQGDRLIDLGVKPVEGSVSVFRVDDKDKREHITEIPMLVSGDAGSVPQMVTDVAVSAKDTTATITWSSTANATSYVVYRNGVAIGYPAGTSFNDSNLTPETKYTYTVVAKNGAGQSVQSAEVVITTATSGTHAAGVAVKATREAIQKAQENASGASLNGLYFKMTQGGNGIQLSDEAVVGAAYAVYYVVKQDGVSSYTINALKFATNYEIYADAVIRSRDGEDKFAQIHFTNVKPAANVTFNQNSEQVTSLSLEFDLLADENNDQAIYEYIE